MKRIHVAALAPLLLAPLGTLAQTSFDVAGLFERVDTDGDGRITPAEIRPDSGTDFRKYDLDGDGLLSRDEVRKQQLLHLRLNGGGRGALTPAQFEYTVDLAFTYFDFDRDGRITQEDYIQRGISQLLLADYNSDGVVTADELRRLHGQLSP